MHQSTAAPTRIRISRLIVSTIAIVGPLGQIATADDLLGAYLGGSVGWSDQRATNLTFTGAQTPDPLSVSESATGWKVFAGVRPIPLLGAELSYLDFGRPTVTQGPPAGFGLAYDVKLHSKATTAFGIIYLPIPVPILDVYAKAGVARLQTQVQGTGFYGCWVPLECAAFPVTVRLDRTDERFAYGVGIQAKVSVIGARLEYERVNAGGGNPDMLSLGVIWTF